MMSFAQWNNAETYFGAVLNISCTIQPINIERYHCLAYFMYVEGWGSDFPKGINFLENSSTS